MDPAELRSALVDLNSLMVGDLAALWRAMDGQDVEFLREALQAELPGVVDPYLAASGDITATWYESQAPELAYVARPAALVDEGQLQATARWAAGTVLTRTPVTPLDLLAGAMQRALFNESRETIVQNSAAEPGARWARHASANACEFCKMVATRGGVYYSEESATRVTGVNYGGTDYRKARKLGKTVNQVPVGGRTEYGRKSRRSITRLGDKYHDHCHCIAVPVRPGQEFDPPSYAEEWEAEYTRARQAADGVDAKSILSAWRKLQPE